MQQSEYSSEMLQQHWTAHSAAPLVVVLGSDAVHAGPFAMQYAIMLHKAGAAS
jgi:hypothetical protein